MPPSQDPCSVTVITHMELFVEEPGPLIFNEKLFDNIDDVHFGQETTTRMNSGSISELMSNCEICDLHYESPVTSRRPSVATLVSSPLIMDFPEELPRELKIQPWLKRYSIDAWTSSNRCPDRGRIPYLTRHSSSTTVVSHGEEEQEITRCQDHFYSRRESDAVTSTLGKQEPYTIMEHPSTVLPPPPVKTAGSSSDGASTYSVSSQCCAKLPCSLIYTDKGGFPDWSVLAAGSAKGGHKTKRDDQKQIECRWTQTDTSIGGSVVRTSRTDPSFRKWACPMHHGINFACRSCNPSGDPMKFPF